MLNGFKFGRVQCACIDKWDSGFLDPCHVQYTSNNKTLQIIYALVTSAFASRHDKIHIVGTMCNTGSTLSWKLTFTLTFMKT